MRNKASQSSTAHRASSEAPYQVLAGALVGAIESGRYPVGSLLPPEPVLCAHYGLSRHSVREAVGKLVQMGLVTRHRGIGTKVVSNETGPQDFAAVTSLKALFKYIQETSLKISNERWVFADAMLADTLGCRVGQRWLEVTGYRYPRNDQNPLSHTVLYISPAFEDIRPHLAEFNRPVYALIEELYGQQVQDMQMSVTAVSIPGKIAKQLGCKPQSPGLRVVRRYRGASDALFSVSISTYPSSRFEVSIRYRLDWIGAA